MNRCFLLVLLAVTGSAHAGSYYPASCLDYPLPQTPVGPTVTAQIPLFPLSRTIPDLGGNIDLSVNLDLELWRQPCDAQTSAILINISQASNAVINLSFTSDPPRVSLAPESGEGLVLDVPFGQVPTGHPFLTRNFLRLVEEPNTQVSESGAVAFGQEPRTFVLEIDPHHQVDAQEELSLIISNNPFDFFALAEQPQVDFFLPGFPAEPPEPVVIPAYRPQDYPAMPQAVEISGRVSGSFYRAEAAGEGVLIDIGERDDGSLFLLMAWFTYDAHGQQRWLVGSTDFSNGQHQLELPISVAEGGIFPFAAAAHVRPWGQVGLSFPDCDHLELTYRSEHNSNDLPAGSGKLVLDRLTSTQFAQCGIGTR